MRDKFKAAKASSTQPANLTEGDEDIEIAGKKIHAHWMKDTRGEATSTTFWVSDQVPGGMTMIKDVDLVNGKPSRERIWKIVEIKEP